MIYYDSHSQSVCTLLILIGGCGGGGGGGGGILLFNFHVKEVVANAKF